MTAPNGKVIADVAGTYPTNQTSQVTMTAKEAHRFVLADAWDRAGRSLKTGIGLDISIAVALAVATLLPDFAWTTTYWIVLGTAVVKSVLSAASSYILRRKSTPKVGVQV